MIECEIIENEETIKKTSVGKAIVGGILAGGAAAIIGSTMGKQNTFVTSLQLRIITTNFDNPLIIIDLIDLINLINNNKIIRGGEVYTKCMDFANKVYAVCTAIISKNTKIA